MSACYFLVNKSMVFVLAVLISSGRLLQQQTATNLVRDSLFIEELSSSSDNKADKEITFMSFNGSLLNDSKYKTTTKHRVINDTTVSVMRSESSLPLKRGRRYLDLLENTRMFFRVNGRNNVLRTPTIWAYGYGFRCTFTIEKDKKVRPFRRDTYETLGVLMDKSDFDGKACILKAFCAAHIDEDIRCISNGMLFKLFKYIFTLNDDDKRHFPYLKYENCHQILHSHCPLSFNNISPFTDDV